jgi:exoribonuclease R
LPEDAVVDTHSKQQVEESIMDLFKLSSVMRIRRYEEGALSLNSVKLAFTLDDKDDPIGVVICGSTEANKLVEEFMLLANFSVAEKIYEAYPFIALLRRHPRPIERRLVSFLLFWSSSFDLTFFFFRNNL